MHTETYLLISAGCQISCVSFAKDVSLINFLDFTPRHPTMNRTRVALSMSHERPWIFFNKTTNKWGACAWVPFWKAKSQSLNYIQDNFVAVNTNGSWTRNLWRASKQLDEVSLPITISAQYKLAI